MAQRAPHYHDDEDNVVTLPYRFEICGHCRGHGRSSAYLGAFTRDDMDEQGPDFFEDYMSGVYDRHCDECDGTGKVMVADRSQMTPDQIRAYDAECEAEDDCRAEEEAERRYLYGPNY